MRGNHRESGSVFTCSRREWLGAMMGLGVWGCTASDTAQAWNISVVGGASELGRGPKWIHTDAPEDWSSPLAQRGHGVAVDPRQEQVVLVARRPGTQLWIREVKTGTTRTVEAPAWRHYLGHAVFDAQGRYLYVTENVFGEYDPALPVPQLMQDAVIGVYDRDQGYARVREIPAHGVGSHELRWMPDGQTLVIANGGIYTHPQEAREMLNPDHLAPSLVYVDAQTGVLQEKVEPQDPRLSVRHLCVNAAGRVTVGLQYQGAMADVVPLVLSHTRGQAPRYWEIPEAMRIRMKQYTASVETHPGAGTTAVSAPKAGAVLLFDPQGAFVRAHELPDAAGLGVAQDGFVASSGTGVLALLTAQNLTPIVQRTYEGHAWDNHLAVWGEA